MMTSIAIVRIAATLAALCVSVDAASGQADITAIVPNWTPMFDDYNQGGAGGGTRVGITYPYDLGPALSVSIGNGSGSLIAQMRHGDSRTAVVTTPSRTDAGAVGWSDAVDVRVITATGEAVSAGGLVYAGVPSVFVDPLGLPMEGAWIVRHGRLPFSDPSRILFGPYCGCGSDPWIDVNLQTGVALAPPAPSAGPRVVRTNQVSNSVYPYSTGHTVVLYGDTPPPPVITATHRQDSAVALEFSPIKCEHADVSVMEYQINGSGVWIAAPRLDSPLVVSGLSNSETYIVQVRARNIFGASEPSLPVSASPMACSVTTLMTSAQEFSAAGGEAVLAVASSGDECVWDIAVSSDWISLSDSAAFGADASIEFSVLPNDTGSLRVAYFRVSERVVPIVQHPDRCTGDLDGNGIVSGADVGLLLLQWGPCD